MQLAYLPDRKRELMIDDDAGSIDSEISSYGRSEVTDLDELKDDYKRNRKRGMLGWFKLKVNSFALALLFLCCLACNRSYYIRAMLSKRRIQWK